MWNSQGYLLFFISVKSLLPSKFNGIYVKKKISVFLVQKIPEYTVFFKKKIKMFYCNN